MRWPAGNIIFRARIAPPAHSSEEKEQGYSVGMELTNKQNSLCTPLSNGSIECTIPARERWIRRCQRRTGSKPTCLRLNRDREYKLPERLGVQVEDWKARFEEICLEKEERRYCTTYREAPLLCM